MPTTAAPPRLLILAATALLLPAAWVFSQDAPDESARLIRQRVEQLHNLRRQQTAAAEAHTQHLQQLQRQIDRLNHDLAAATALAQQQRELRDESQRRLDQAHQRGADAEQRITQIVDAALPVLRRIEQRLATGLTYRKTQRLAQIQQILQATQAGEPKPAAEALQTFWTFASEELRLARSIDLFNETVQIDSRHRPAYLVRMGLVGELLIAEDGQTLAVSRTASATPWDTNLSDEQRRQLRAALAILQQRQPPQIAPVPFPLIPGGQP